MCILVHAGGHLCFLLHILCGKCKDPQVGIWEIFLSFGLSTHSSIPQPSFLLCIHIPPPHLAIGYGIMYCKYRLKIPTGTTFKSLFHRLFGSQDG